MGVAVEQKMLAEYPQTKSKKGNVIGRKRAIRTEKRQALDPGLRDQHAIERVCMMRGQGLDGTGMVPGDRQRQTAGRRSLIEQVDGHHQFAQGPLDGNFPDRNSTDMNFGFGVGQSRPETLWQGRILQHCPDQHMGIDQQFHYGATALAANNAATSASPS